MKKLMLLLTTSLCLTIACNGQITKNNWMFGGSGSFSRDKGQYINQEIVSTNIDFLPRIGYFFADRFGAGLLGNFNYGSSKDNLVNLKSSYYNYGIGPFVRYYLLNEVNRVNIAVDAFTLYNGSANKSSSATSFSSNSSNISYGIYAGPSLFLNSSVGVELLLGYKGFKTDNLKTNGINLKLGIQVYLEKQE